MIWRQNISFFTIQISTYRGELKLQSYDFCKENN